MTDPNVPNDPTDPNGSVAAVVNHAGLCVTDLERSTRFYVELLGFAIERELPLPDEAVSGFLGVEAPVGFTARYLRLGAFTLELLHFDRAGNPPAATRVFNEPGLTHLSFSVADLEVCVARVPELGGSTVTAYPVAAIVRDPDGQLLELLPMSYRDRLPS